MRNKYILLSLAFALVVPVYAQKQKSAANSEQRQDEMRKTVEYLASQELGGRYPGTRGDTLASEYITSQLRSLKLKPIVKGKVWSPLRAEMTGPSIDRGPIQ